MGGEGDARSQEWWLDLLQRGRTERFNAARAEAGHPWLDLMSADLHGTELGPVCLDRVELEGADLRGASIGKAGLFRTIFADCRIDGLHGHEDTVWRIQLAVALWSGLDALRLLRARHPGRLLNLVAVYLAGADLQGVDLEGAWMGDAHLAEADLAGAKLDGIVAPSAVLVRCGLRGASLRGASLPGALLQDADLRGACLDDANLEHADLRGGDLRGASLRQSYLVGADLAEARLEGAHLEEAIGLVSGGPREGVGS